LHSSEKCVTRQFTKFVKYQPTTHLYLMVSVFVYSWKNNLDKWKISHAGQRNEKYFENVQMCW